MFILETAAQDPNPAVVWIGGATAVVVSLAAFWGKLKTLYQSISETFTNREAIRRELFDLAEKFKGMINTQEKMIETMQEVVTNDKMRGMKVDELEKQLEAEREALVELRERVAHIEGRLSK